MSEVKVDTISERTAAGGVTIDGVLVKDGVATFQTAAGSPLVFEGATADAFETTFAITDPTADRTITFPDSSFTVPTSGGLTTASQWRLTTDFTNTAVPIATNLEEVDAPVGFGVLGSSMTQSSGVFTFPSTGYWLITFCTVFHCTVTSNDNQSAIQTCIDHTAGPTFVNAVWGSESVQGSQQTTHSLSYIFDVTNTTECKCQFTIPYVSATTNVTTKGDTAFNETCMTFIKLGDT
jgi:hypothetical protein